MTRTASSSTPTANVSINRNRIKTYGDKVYLKSGTNFEIELWNPKTTRVLVNIKIDGRLISSSGIVLNPGQRVYLERWIDDAKKFLFSTYEVENSGEAKKAIQDNGRIEVTFHDEQTIFPLISTTVINTPLWNYPSQPSIYPHSSPWDNTIIYGSGTGNFNMNTSCFTSSTNCFSDSSASMSFFSSDLQSSPKVGEKKFRSTPKGVLARKSTETIETGRAEKGENSSQSFATTTGNFNSWASTTSTWQILPESQLPVEADKIRSYCPYCATRIRSAAWKFCPSCSNSLKD